MTRKKAMERARASGAGGGQPSSSRNPIPTVRGINKRHLDHHVPKGRGIRSWRVGVGDSIEFPGTHAGGADAAATGRDNGIR